MSAAVSIIIPTYNEAESIGETLRVVKSFAGNPHSIEIIVVDGDSADATAAIVKAENVKIIVAPRGRGSQMHAGAQAATGDVLWFLHADTTPPSNGIAEILRVLENKNVVAGNFTIRFDGAGNAARFLTWLYPNLRKIGLCYGDSAIFVRREIYEKVGGFQPFPIFEDLDLINKIRRKGEIVYLAATVVTSSRRFENKNFAFVFTRWMLMQGLFWLGVSPYFLAKFYQPIRRRKIGINT